MRLLALALVLALSTPAYADRKTNNRDGGRLGKVSSGIERATSKQRDTPAHTNVAYASCHGCSSTVRSWPSLRMPSIHVDVDGFAGAQKVYESDASLSLELSLILQHRLRFNAAVSHYFENQMDGSRITLAAPSLTGGVMLNKPGPTRLWFEAGIVHVRTTDPAGDSAITGSVLGARIEHDLGPMRLVGSGGAMLFDGIIAGTGRVAVRWNHVEAGFRFLDFSVGPALFGPEVGVTF